MTIKLYCFGESGNSYKAALMLELAKLEWEPVFVDFFNGEARSDTFRDNLNEMGEVPVMIDGDVKLTQSGVMQDYISSKTGLFGGRSAAGIDTKACRGWAVTDGSEGCCATDTVSELISSSPCAVEPSLKRTL